MTPTKTGEKEDLKQTEMEGFRPPKVRQVEAKFKLFLDAKSAANATKLRMTDARQALLEIMKEHKTPIYEFRGYTAKLEEEEKVLIHKTGEGEEGPNGEAGEGKSED